MIKQNPPAIGLVVAPERRCDEVQDRIVLSLRAREELDGASWQAHARDCEECGAFALMTQRAQAHYQAAELTDAELKRLRLRLMPGALPARSFGTSVRKKAGWLVAGAFGLGATAALAHGGWRLLNETSPRADSISAPTSASPSQGDTDKDTGSGAERRTRKADTTEPLDANLEALAHEEGTGISKRPATSEASRDREVTPKSSRAGTEDATPGALSARSAATQKAEATEREQLKWAHAAEALRNNDRTQADAALRDLSKSSDENTRERAQLGLAQLWLEQGKNAEARSLLSKLQKSQSAFVRERAADLLR